jgi:misacylated tRNA(Ala) deacylase
MARGGVATRAHSGGGRKAARLARMHTAEHLLTAVMRQLYGSSRNIEFHLGDKKTKCDYEVPHPLGPEDARAIEAAVNAAIAQDHHVTVMRVTRSDAEHLDLWKVPADEETIRVVQIGGIDATPCSGDHVERTSEIGRFVLKSYEMRTSALVRIRFGLEDPAQPGSHN